MMLCLVYHKHGPILKCLLTYSTVLLPVLTIYVFFDNLSYKMNLILSVIGKSWKKLLSTHNVLHPTSTILLDTTDADLLWFQALFPQLPIWAGFLLAVSSRRILDTISFSCCVFLAGVLTPLVVLCVNLWPVNCYRALSS